MLDAIQRRLLSELFATLGAPETVNDEPVTASTHALELIENETEAIVRFRSGLWIYIVPENGTDWFSDFPIGLQPTVEALFYPPSLETAAADLYEAARFYAHVGSCLFGKDRATDCNCDWHRCILAVAKAEQEV